MQNIVDIMRKRALQLFNEGVVTRAIGWKKGEFDYDETPHIFTSADEIADLVYDSFS